MRPSVAGLCLWAALTAGVCESTPIFDMKQEVQGVLGRIGQEAGSGMESDGGVRPEVDSEQLQALITEENLRAREEKLLAIAETSNSTFGHPTRVIGSKGHWKTIGYIKRELRRLGGYYKVRVQPFKAFYGEVFSCNATVNGTFLQTVGPMDMSPATESGKPAEGHLVAAQGFGCDPSDFPSDVSGAVVLVRRGNCSFGTKSALSGKVGARAAIVYNNEDGPVRGTLGTPNKSQPYVPTVAISRAEGERLVALLGKGEVLEASVAVDSFVGIVHTANVIAETRQGDPDNVVMLGAHSDSVAAGPGINDDGSGTVSLLEVARQLAKFKINNRVRFAWWAAEEEGLLGSNFYAETLRPDENSRIRLFMDYDMMASPNYEYEVYDAKNAENPNGSQQLRDLYIDYYEQHGLNYTLIPFDGRSDYVGFIEHHIPAGGIATGAEKKNVFNGRVLDRCYHQRCDDLSNLAYDAFLVNTRLIAHSVATYAKSFDGFPDREPLPSVKAESSGFKYRGGKMVM
ncbi:hypothetical protein BRETT_002624 [Brettanomyces bruxellensis]|uniref:Peptide hydrolase n=1 Tax=Dekkera bruxellensis TaxID=5007 RepID=A0A871RCV2_DEKBR|nr:uncharacterized protein BRETT_002624 [Brettanomyces bruxellensis]QOU22444.1 hypothetical protein BRETT_002624 [Brettanomyces bruxellensis]